MVLSFCFVLDVEVVGIQGRKKLSCDFVFFGDNFSRLSVFSSVFCFSLSDMLLANEEV